MPKGQAPRPKRSAKMKLPENDNGEAARNFLMISEMSDPKTKRWEKINRNNPQEIWDRFVFYCRFCEQNGIVPTWMGVCGSWGYLTESVDDWMNGIVKINLESLQLVKRLRDNYESFIVHLMAKNQVNNITGMFILRNFNPNRWAVELTKGNGNVNIQLNIGDKTAQQLAEKWEDYLECDYKIVDKNELPEHKEIDNV